MTASRKTRHSTDVQVVAHGDGYELRGDAGSLRNANRFITALEVRGLSARTTRAYAYDLVILFRWLRNTGKDLEALCESDLLDWIQDQRHRRARPRSINRRLTTCRQLYRFATGHEIPRGIYTTSPAPHFAGPGRDRALGLHQRRRPARLQLRVKVPRTLIEPLRPDQVRAFLRRLRRYRDLAIVHLLLLCGLRSREVRLLEVQDVDFDQRCIRVQGKGNKERTLPLPDVAIDILRKYLRLERPRRSASVAFFVVLQGKRRGQPLTEAGLRSLFRHRRRRAGLASANPHRFRHTFGTDMARAGVRLPVLQRMLGHANAAMTLQYIELSMVDVADEYRRAIAALEGRYRSR